MFINEGFTLTKTNSLELEKKGDEEQGKCILCVFVSKKLFIAPKYL